MAEQKVHQSGPLKDAEVATEDAKVVDSMEGRMDNLKVILDGKEPTDQSDELDDSTSDDQEKDDQEKDDQTDDSESEDDSTSESKEVEEEEEKGSKDKDSTPEAVDIPDGYVRAAKRQGWTDEDIAATIKADFDRARRLFQNAYETSNKATRDFAAIGRAQADATRQKAEEQARVETPEIKDFMTLDEIKTAAGDDAAMEAILKGANKMIKDQATEIAKRGQPGPSANELDFARSDQVAATARANATADANALMQIDQFFGADDMESYSEFYGVIKPSQDMDDITPRQRGHRIEVLQIADQLVAGKASQGIQITANEALGDAHLLVTDSMREKIIAGKMKSSLKKRTKTLRPSDSKKTKASGDATKAKTREQAIANAETRLAKFNKSWNN